MSPDAYASPSPAPTEAQEAESDPVSTQAPPVAVSPPAAYELEEPPFADSPGTGYYRDALRARAQNDTEYAIEMLREAVAADPEHTDAWLLLFEMARAGEDPNAVAEACAGLLANRAYVGWEAGQLNLECALVHRQIGQLADAEQFARRSVEFGGDRLEPLITLSGILVEAQRGEAAVEALEGRIRVPGGNLEASALSNLGLAYTQMERYDEAIATFELALAQSRGRADIEISLASALHGADRNPEAIELLERVVERDPTNQAALQRLEAWR